MTEVVLTTDEADAYVRDRIEQVLVTHNTYSPKVMHILSDEKWMQPLCCSETKSGDWLDKLVTMYPHRPFCKKCVKQRFGIEVIDE